MNILLYTHSFAPNVGGVETFVARLASELPRVSPDDAFKITVVTNTPGAGETVQRERRQVVRCPGRLGLWRLVGRADIILLAGPAFLPLVFGLLRGKKVVVTHHGYQTICPNGLLFHRPSESNCPGHYRMKHYFECVRCCGRDASILQGVKQTVFVFPRRLACRLAQRNVAVSEHLANRIQLSNTVVIRNGVPITKNASEFTYQKSCSRFLFVGRMVVEKGVRVLVDAAKILRNRGLAFHILLLGDGPERPALEQLSKQPGLQGRVEFAGFKTGRAFETLVNEPSFSVLPSIWEDVAPFAPLEQMMAGKAMIASDIGGLAEEVEGVALKFPPSDANALADRMQELLQSPALAAQLGAKARERARRSYSEQEMILRYAELLRSL